MGQNESFPAEFRSLLDTLDEPEKLMGTVLHQATVRAGAFRGLIFDQEQVVRAVQYDHNEALMVRKTLAKLLLKPQGVMRASAPFFAAFDANAEPCGMAGALTGPTGCLAVLAVESEVPFNESQLADFGDWLGITSKLVSVSLSHDRLRRLVRRAPLRFRDLPLQDLEVLPNLQEVEVILIEAAMRRNQNNRGKVAETLGISRETIRKKLLR